MGYGMGPPSPYYVKSAPPRGAGPFNDRFSWTSHSFIGVKYNDGRDDAFNAVKDGLNEGDLQTKATAWGLIHDDVKSTYSTLTQLYTDTFKAWSGDDADQAQQTFAGTVNSLHALTDYTDQMHQGMTAIHNAVRTAKGSGGDGSSFWSDVGNYELGGDTGGADAEQAYFNLVAGIQAGRDAMPSEIEHQTKGGRKGGEGGQQPPGPGPGPGSLHGASAPHLGSGSVPHQSVGPIHGIGSPGMGPGGVGPGGVGPGGIGPGGVGPGGVGPGGVGPGGIGPGGVGPGGVGPGGIGPGGTGLGSGSSLAGLDGGAGGLSAGGGSGLGAGAAGGLGSAGGAGGGLGGAGSLGGGAGAGGALSGAPEAAGAAGAGGRMGMMPMRPGGSGSDEDERERSTWLTEDDDVWGGDDAPPGVIG